MFNVLFLYIYLQSQKIYNNIILLKVHQGTDILCILLTSKE